MAVHCIQCRFSHETALVPISDSEVKVIVTDGSLFCFVVVYASCVCIEYFGISRVRYPVVLFFLNLQLEKQQCLLLFI